MAWQVCIVANMQRTLESWALSPSGDFLYPLFLATCVHRAEHLDFIHINTAGAAAAPGEQVLGGQE
jgi:hypothetical protein